ncbi:MAG: response regulator [Euryarchaeota archaeon]|nr:response regulator [Euryarchaeota archaeon]
MGRRYLVVDDSLTIRLVMQQILARLGAMPDDISLAEDGIQAVELFKKVDPDVVFMDIEMPRMTGNEAATEILKVKATARVVVMTGVDSKDQRVRNLLAQGAYDLIEKPIRFDRIQQLIHLMDVEDGRMKRIGGG